MALANLVVQKAVRSRCLNVVTRLQLWMLLVQVTALQSSQVTACHVPMTLYPESSVKAVDAAFLSLMYRAASMGRNVSCCYKTKAIETDLVVHCKVTHYMVLYDATTVVGRSIAQPNVTAYCSADNNMVVAISKDLTVPSLILDSVRIVDVDSSSCPNLRVAATASFIGYQFPLSCGGPKQVDGTSMVYERTVEATKTIRTWQMGSITRDSTMRVTVRCTYTQIGAAPLQVEVLTLPPPLPVSTSGPLLLEMRIAQDERYASYYADQDYPIERILRDPVHAEVRILQRTDPSLILVLNNCWATNSPVPTEAPQWPILVNSCPFEGDSYLTQLAPVGPSSQNLPLPTHYKRFIVSAFTFVDSATQTALKGLVFLHCSASVCVPSATESCAVTCPQRQKRAVGSLATEDALTMVSAHGPVVFLPEEMRTDEVLGMEGPLGSDLALAWLQGAAAAGFVVMVSLLGIYKYRRQRKCVVSTINA
ncbi:zona pellucida sperm-binding protein 4-like [Dendropsophus ebraccatus]|uniref:zona pellucida sperm-binding protein 4-like n=1 Tax=Dendropsophus ebraccatus TaxID=150705 RepID=UPI003831B76B